MSYEFYKAYRLVSSTPSQGYKDDLQALIDDQFDNASTWFTVKEEQTFGKLDWSEDFEVRITHIISDKNVGEKLGDDFRNLIFKNMDYNYVLGKRYSFNENFWITTNTDSFKYPTASACIRRCNNVLNHYDEYGNLHIEPCIVDNQIRKTDFDFNSAIVIPEGHLTVIVQGNDWTKSQYKINKRFILGGQPWKCTFINNFQRINTLNSSSVNIIRMILMKDSIATDDDIINDIPNIKSFMYLLSINQGTSLSQNINFQIQLTTTLKLNDEIITLPLKWQSSDSTICSVDNNGNISLLKVGSCTITCSMQDNSSVFSSITINVVNVVSNVKTNIITPQQTEILQGDEILFHVNGYVDGMVNSDTFNVSASGVPSNYYKLTVVDSNSFKIKNLKLYNSGKLHIVCTNDSDSSSVNLDISLKGIYL